MHNYRAAHAVHSDFIERKIFHSAGSSPSGFYSDAAVGSVKDAIGDFNISNTACGFRPHYNAAMTMQHITVLYDNVFAGFIYTDAVFADAGFKDKTIIIHVEITVGYLNAVAGIDV